MLKNLNFKFRQTALSAKVFATVTPAHLYYKVIKNVIKNSFHLYAPSSAILGLTYKCQCHCVHCSAGLYEKNPAGELTTKEWLYVLDEAAALGVPRINVSGGEALLREDIFEVLAYATKKFVTVLESNGEMLKEEVVSQLKESRVSCVAVSIDSFTPSVHNRLRGRDNCFEKAVAGIRNCVKLKVPCLISTYLTNERADHQNIGNLMALARRLGVMAVRVMPPRPVGSFSCHVNELLNKRNEEFILSNIDPGVAYFIGMPAPRLCGIFTKSTFYISPYGDLQPCPFMPLSFGNIRKEKLSVMVSKMWSHAIFSAEKDRKCLVLNKYFRDRYLHTRDADKKDGTQYPIAVA